MTDPQESYPVPDSTVVDGTVRNGQCAPDGFSNNHHQNHQNHHQPQARSPGQSEPYTTGHEMKITDSVEGEGLLESSMRLKPHEAQNYRKKALWVSWVSIVVTLMLAVAAFTLSFMRHSASAFGFAFDASLDVMSSFIVLWRYSNAAAVHSAHREYIACVVLGVVFVLSSLCILGKAIHNLATKMLPEVDDFLFSVSIVSGFTCILLAVAKFMLGRVLTSRALFTDAFNSMIGAVMGFSILISAEVYKQHPDVWFLDGTIGVLMALLIFGYGVKLLRDMVPRVRQTRNYERFE
ncbi:transmembrane protein 163a-like [Limanda limanda]|uniref:transmembrane protein 163a-like n=1 Tax=Limanda limanda TaxID=27771 RepID=UPI0029C766F6|nr:transmembrane protein 163a-like [Limanda limanda]